MNTYRCGDLLKMHTYNNAIREGYVYLLHKDNSRAKCFLVVKLFFSENSLESADSDKVLFSIIQGTDRIGKTLIIGISFPTPSLQSPCLQQGFLV